MIRGKNWNENSVVMDSIFPQILYFSFRGILMEIANYMKEFFFFFCILFYLGLL